MRRIKKNIQSRKWDSKSMKTNIDYIKKQLKQFGLSAPKYLNKDKKLTQKQIASIYNITQSRVSFIISKNLDKIKKILEKEKYIDYRTKNKRIRKKCK